MTGGYKIIDLYGLDLANMQLDSTKIEKIFNDIESTYKTKALLFDNYKINGIEQNATFSSAIVKNSGFEITLGDYKLLIKNDSVSDTTLHLYRHDITFNYTSIPNGTGFVQLTIYNTINEPIPQESFKNLLTTYNTMCSGYDSYNKGITGIYIQGDYIKVSCENEEASQLSSVSYYYSYITKIF